MEALFAAVKFVFVGFFGLIAVLVLLALVFGKRIKKQWEFEAEFHDADGREFGEFDIESSRIAKEEPDYTLKAKLHMRHTALTLHASVQVFVEETLILDGRVETEGRVVLDNSHLQVSTASVHTGQDCRVLVGGAEIARAEMRAD
ncbi:MAG: hypothetical protein QNJ00_07760 [Woeseiaceae bacterium]|nr:hypothetical protein [Woeseiaceae bacterium]